MMKEKICYVGYNIHAEIKLAQVLTILYRSVLDVHGLYMGVPDVPG